LTTSGDLVCIDDPTFCVDITNDRVSMRGTSTNDFASTGYVGEFIISYSTNVYFYPYGSWIGVSTITLTPGDWSLSGIGCGFAGTGAGTMPNLRVAISSYTQYYETDHVLGDNMIVGSTPLVGVSDGCGSIPSYRVSIPIQKSFYLKMVCDGGGGTSPKFYGRISALRVR